MSNDNEVPTPTPKTALIEILRKLDERIGKLEAAALAQQEGLQAVIARQNELKQLFDRQQDQLDRLTKVILRPDEDGGGKEGLLN